MKKLQLNLDQLSPQRVASAATTNKVVTPSAVKLRADGCAAELFPYEPACERFFDLRRSASEALS